MPDAARFVTCRPACRRPTKPAPRSLSKAAFNTRHGAKEAKEAAFTLALAWCRANGKGAVACLKANPDFAKKVKVGALNYRLKQLGQKKANLKAVLTPKEESDLVDWLIASSLARNGKSMKEITIKVQDILKVRRAQNKRGGRAHVPFSKAALKIVAGGVPSDKWFPRFFSTLGRLGLGKLKAAREGREAKAAQALANSVLRAETKAAKSVQAAALLAKWKVCKGECKCAAGVKPCDASKLVLCPHCDVLKKNTCRVGSCKTAAAAVATADAAARDPDEINIDDMEEEPDRTI